MNVFHLQYSYIFEDLTFKKQRFSKRNFWIICLTELQNPILVLHLSLYFCSWEWVWGELFFQVLFSSFFKLSLATFHQLSAHKNIFFFIQHFEVGFPLFNLESEKSFLVFAICHCSLLRVFKNVD